MFPTQKIFIKQDLIFIEAGESTIELFDLETLKKLRKDYQCIHFGLIQIALKPLRMNGLNSSLCLYLRVRDIQSLKIP